MFQFKSNNAIQYNMSEEESHILFLHLSFYFLSFFFFAVNEFFYLRTRYERPSHYSKRTSPANLHTCDFNRCRYVNKD